MIRPTQVSIKNFKTLKHKLTSLTDRCLYPNKIILLLDYFTLTTLATDLATLHNI